MRIKDKLSELDVLVASFSPEYCVILSINAYLIAQSGLVAFHK